MGPDGHGQLSLTMALVRSHCGPLSAYTPSYGVPAILLAHPELDGVPLEQVAIAAAGSLETYCASSQPVLGVENSLMLLETAILYIRPRASLWNLQVVFRVFRLALIGLFVLGWMRSGASVLCVVPLAVAAIDTQRLLESAYAYTNYPLILPVVFGAIGFYALAWWPAQQWALGRVTALAAALGVYSAFVTNMRSEYLPPLLAMHAVFVLLVWRGPSSRQEAMGHRVAWLCGGFVAGFLAFQALFIWTLPKVGAERTDHVIAHPLVLGLALPANAFAKEQGIQWLDATGLTLARRVDPTVTYLGPKYEHALFVYYFSLWRDHPAEMRSVYLAKAALAGRHAALLISGRDPGWSSFVRRCMGLLLVVPGGFAFLGLALCAMALGTVIALRSWRIGFPVAMMMAATAFLMVQSIIIMPFFYPQYHAVLLVGLIALPVLLVQACLDGIRLLVTATPHR